MNWNGMSTRTLGLILTLAAVLGLSRAVIAQTFPTVLATKAEVLVPDLSGVWLPQAAGASFSKWPPPPMTPWAVARFAANKPTMGPGAVLDANDPTINCIPPGVPYILMVPTPFEILQTPNRTLELFEYNHWVRQIYTDGREHPKDLEDTEISQWMGHSIGKWEGDTLVIDTIGFNDKTWLDRAGHPHSDALHLVERLRRTSHDTLEDNLTIEDPKAYANPWTGTLTFNLKPAWGIMEHICVSPANEDKRYLEYELRAWEIPK